MKLSMSAIWDESAAFIRREAALLVPLTLATLAIGNAGTELSMDFIRATARGGGSGMALLGLLLSLLLIILGKLAVTSLVLVPRQSVGEAIHHAVHRLPKILAINIALGFIFSLLAVPLVILLAKSGIDLTTPSPKLPASAAFYILALFGVGLYLGARLVTLNPTIMDRNPDLATLFKSCFAQTGGVTAKIIGITLLYVVVTLVLTGAITSVAGLVFALVAKAIGAPFAGLVLTALFVGTVAAGLSLIAAVFVAILYRRLTGSSNGM